LTVELDTGEKIETSRKLSVKSEKGTAEHFEIAYLPANFDTQEEYESAVETAQSMAESHLPGIHAENIEENTVDINSCNLDCVIGEGEGQRCINKVNQCVGESSSKPLDSEDANIFHVLCDDDGGEECGTADVLGLASVGGHGSTRWRETDIRDNKETFMHELGHQMGLRHIFSESMLEEKQYGDQVQNIEESTIDGCWIPNEYLENTVLGQNVVDWNGDGLGFPNSEDKYSGGSTDAFFMSYCDSQNRYGPEAGNSIRDYMGVYQ